MIWSCSNTSNQTPDQTSDQETIITIMKAQEDAWNNGDLDQFMAAYLQSDDLSFIGKKGITRGWDKTLENYKKGYPDRKTMGTLEFDNIEFIDLKDHYYVLGKWNLYRESDTLSGHYSLLWKNLNGQWLIIKDHSS